MGQKYSFEEEDSDEGGQTGREEEEEEEREMRSIQLSLSWKVDICPPFLQSAARSHAAPGAMKDERTAVLEWMEGGEGGVKEGKAE